MSSAQFRRRTSELYLPEGIYRLYDSVVKECETCQKTKPAPPRSRFSGVRAKEFGDVVFMDHCEIKHMARKHQRFLPSDGPYAHGDRVFVWIDDKAKYKAVGRWARARVISQNGAITSSIPVEIPITIAV